MSLAKILQEGQQQLYVTFTLLFWSICSCNHFLNFVSPLYNIMKLKTLIAYETPCMLLLLLFWVMTSALLLFLRSLIALNSLWWTSSQKWESSEFFRKFIILFWSPKFPPAYSAQQSSKVAWMSSLSVVVSKLMEASNAPNAPSLFCISVLLSSLNSWTSNSDKPYKKILA